MKRIVGGFVISLVVGVGAHAIAAPGASGCSIHVTARNDGSKDISVAKFRIRNNGVPTWTEMKQAPGKIPAHQTKDWYYSGAYSCSVQRIFGIKNMTRQGDKSTDWASDAIDLGRDDGNATYDFGNIARFF